MNQFNTDGSNPDDDFFDWVEDMFYAGTWFVCTLVFIAAVAVVVVAGFSYFLYV